MLRKIFGFSGASCLKGGSSAAGLRASVWKSLSVESTFAYRNEALIRYFSSAEPEHKFATGRKFEEFEGISQAAIDIFKKKGFEFSFPVQDATWQKVMDGKNLIVREKTGAGKTLGYVLPAIEKLRMSAGTSGKGKRTPKILVLVPTRELCIQVTNQFSQIMSYPSEFYICSLYGGTSIVPQLQMLERGVDIVVATPGRLGDVMGRGSFSGANIDVVVLDETDQMLDIGFADKIMEIVNEIKAERPPQSASLQCLLFSATVPKWVQEASRKLMDKKPEFINLISEDDMKTPASVKHFAIQVRSMDSATEMIPYFLTKYLKEEGRAIIFTNTKHECETVNDSLSRIIHSKVLNGDVSQAQRERVFHMYKSGKLRCLVATNVAARGLDFPQVDLVIQLGPPQDIESYVHRAGRTARAGNSGVCLTFYTRRDNMVMSRISGETGAVFESLPIPSPEQMEAVQPIQSNSLTTDDKSDREVYGSRQQPENRSSYNDTVEGHTRVQVTFADWCEVDSTNGPNPMRNALREWEHSHLFKNILKTGVLIKDVGFVGMLPSEQVSQLQSVISSPDQQQLLKTKGWTIEFPEFRPRTVNPYKNSGERGGSNDRQSSWNGSRGGDRSNSFRRDSRGGDFQRQDREGRGGDYQRPDRESRGGDGYRRDNRSSEGGFRRDRDRDGSQQRPRQSYNNFSGNNSNTRREDV